MDDLNEKIKTAYNFGPYWWLPEDHCEEDGSKRGKCMLVSESEIHNQM
jgi:hypothetical protein